MKSKLFALLLAAGLTLTLCACEKTLPEPTQEELDTVIQEAEASVPEEETIPEAPELPPAPSIDFFDEPRNVEGDIEEIVSYRIGLPGLNMETESTAEAINGFFDEFSLWLQDYAATTVYEAAQQNHTIAFLTGSYELGEDDGLLAVAYYIHVEYADGSEGLDETHTYAFDPADGTLARES